MKRNPVSCARKSFIPATSAQPMMQHVDPVASKDTLSEPISRQNKESKRDLSAMSIHALDTRESREVFAPVVFHHKGDDRQG